LEQGIRDAVHSLDQGIRDAVHSLDQGIRDAVAFTPTWSARSIFGAFLRKKRDAAPQHPFFNLLF